MFKRMTMAMIAGFALGFTGFVYLGCVTKAKKTAVVSEQIRVSAEPGALNQVYYPEGYLARRVLTRSLASPDGSGEYLAYYTYDPDQSRDKRESVEVFSAEKWRGLTAGKRFEMFERMYFGNTRLRSKRKRFHLACYVGNADNVIEAFFSPDDKNNMPVIRNVKGPVENLRMSFSRDQHMIGIDFDVEKRPRHFRMVGCRGSGKGIMFSDETLNRQIDAERGGAAVANSTPVDKPESVDDETMTAEQAKEGFVIHDEVVSPPSGLPKFALRADYNRAIPDNAPWFSPDQDLSNEKGAMDFALALQKYVYQGMANQDKKPDNNFISDPRKSGRPYWCHMPWLNQGAAGREAVHGLTQERNLLDNPIWPNPPLSGDWGIGFFNAIACRSIGDVFGTAENPRPNLEWKNATLPDGAVVFKILFTTGDFPAIHNAFSWRANVNEPNRQGRSLRTMRHIQMDIGVKHSLLKGLPKDTAGRNVAGGWVMLTYYYDKDYKSPLTLDLPEGFKHMRPMGLQTGFDVHDSRIFAGATTNQKQGKLNGPADNAKSSCLGCHGTAGSAVAMAPGIESNQQWSEVVEKEGKFLLDFGQQFALAKRNWETKSRPVGSN